MVPAKLERINELAKKAKTVGLTEEELKEQKELRAEYINEFKLSLIGMLDNTYIQDPDGNKRKLEKKNLQ